MDRKKMLELIKLDVLSCLNEKDKEAYEAFKLNHDDFPWKDLGDYQHLVAFIPSILEIKYPESDLKDKTALKLFNIREEIKAKIEAKKAVEIPAEPISEEIAVSDKSLFEQNEDFQAVSGTEDKAELETHIEVEENVLFDSEEGLQINKEETLTSKDTPFKIKSNLKEKSKFDTLLQDFKTDIEPNIASKPSVTIDKDLIEKIVKEQFKLQVNGEFELLKKSIKTSKILSFVFFIISLILILALYFFN